MKRTLVMATVLVTSALFGLASAQQPSTSRTGERGPMPPDRKRKDEGQEMRPPMGHSMPVSSVMLVLDVDQNGELSAEEIKNASEMLLTLDKDDDGKLSGEELAPPPHPGDPRFVQYIMGFDADGDKKVSKEELPKYLQSLLEVADSSGDDALTQHEVNKMSKRQQQQRPPRRRQ